MGKVDLNFLSQNLDNKELNSFKQKGFDSYENISDVEKFCQEKKSFIVLSQVKKDKEYEHVLKIGNTFKWKRWKIITTCT